MNEMYSMSIIMHDAVIVALIVAILVNIGMLRSAVDRKKYTKKMRIYMPFSVMSLVAVMFTGVVMMAAKHLDFNLPNLVMIMVSVVLIVLESKRYSALKYMDRTREEALEEYKAKAMRIMLIELAFVIIISIWMFLI